MKKTFLEKTADKLVDAFINNKIIKPLPIKYTKMLVERGVYNTLVAVRQRIQISARNGGCNKYEPTILL